MKVYDFDDCILLVLKMFRSKKIRYNVMHGQNKLNI